MTIVVVVVDFPVVPGLSGLVVGFSGSGVVVPPLSPDVVGNGIAVVKCTTKKFQHYPALRDRSMKILPLGALQMYPFPYPEMGSQGASFHFPLCP